MKKFSSRWMWVVCVFTACAAARAGDVLPSWNESAARNAVVEFVGAVTDAAGPDYVAPEDRVAVFDNDGCLWSERPVYFQLYFAIDRIKAMAADHPEWMETEPFASVLKGDMEAVAAGGEEAIIKLVMATHTGMTTEEFDAIVRDWVATARHPVTGRLYTEMVYQPMLEVLDYLRANGFRTYIVSGGGIDFVRPWAQAVYGIPPEQVVGSSVKVKFEVRDGKPVLVRLPELNFIDDKEGKPVGIHQHIARRPVAAFGNSDGDFQMMEWTSGREGRSLCVYIHHDDADREWAYDRDSHIGRLARGLDEAGPRGWHVVSMKNDWSRIYPGDETEEP